MSSVIIPQPKIHNGLACYELLACLTTTHLATVTINEKEKLVFHDATFVIDLITGSYKYGANGCELQFNFYAREPPTLEKRVDKVQRYNRGEFGYLPGTHETADLLRNVADQIDLIINYEPVTFQVDHRPPLRILDKNCRLEDV